MRLKGPHVSRPEQVLTEADARQILSESEYGTLATVSSDGSPYAVAVNYVYSPDDNAVFFHCFARGLKLENIAHEPRVAFSVVGEEELVPERLSTRYRSALVRGRASVVSSDEEKATRLVELSRRLAPEYEHTFGTAIQKYLHKTAVVRIDIDSVTGKMNSGRG